MVKRNSLDKMLKGFLGSTMDALSNLAEDVGRGIDLYLGNVDDGFEYARRAVRNPVTSASLLAVLGLSACTTEGMFGTGGLTFPDSNDDAYSETSDGYDTDIQEDDFVEPDTPDTHPIDTPDVGEDCEKKYFGRDADEDGFGDPAELVEACEKPDGYSDLLTDCDDTDKYVNPAAEEVCDNVDNNCDMLIDMFDENTSITQTAVCDNYNADGDGTMTSTCIGGEMVAGECLDPDECELEDIMACPLDSSLPGFECVDVEGTAIWAPLGNENTGVFADGVDNDCDGKIDNHPNYWENIPAGTFQMGEPLATSDAGPVHTVNSDDYKIMKSPATNKQVREFYKAIGVDLADVDVSSHTREDYLTNPAYDNFPAVNMDWATARTFSVWLGGNKEDLEEVLADPYTMKRFDSDLQTEAQYEKAARGGEEIPNPLNPDNMVPNPKPLRTFPWGDDEPTADLVNYDMIVGDTTEVGSFPEGASPYGVMGLSGNVMEWTFDKYSSVYYASSPAENPIGPQVGNKHVARGGGYKSMPDFITVHSRFPIEPELKGNQLGFRSVTTTDDF